MPYTFQKIAEVAYRSHHKYAIDHFVEDNLQIVRSISTIDGIPISWLEAWETDESRGAWGRDIQEDNTKSYEGLIREVGEVKAVELLNSQKSSRAAYWELREGLEEEEEESGVREDYEITNLYVKQGQKMDK